MASLKLIEPYPLFGDTQSTESEELDTRSVLRYIDTR